MLICACLSVFSQNKVRYLTIDQGLANNTITCISRDHKGFMWFGTFDGLNRYDGYVFKKYSHVIGDSTSLRSNIISAIAEDNAGRHWIVAGPGVSVLDDKATVFSRVKYLPFNPNASNNSGVAKRLDSSVHCVVNDGHGNMLVGARRAGFIVFRNGSMTGQQLPLLYHGKMITDYTVRSLYTGRDGQIWMAVDKVGIGLYDAHAGAIIIKYESSINVNCFQQFHNDTLLAGTANTLYQYAISSSRLSPYKLQNGDTLRSGLVRSLCDDGSGRCWVGSDGNGISIVDMATHRLLPMENIIGQQTISSNAINCLYKDADRRIWIGTLRGGVNMIDHDRKPFYSVKLENDKNKNPANNFIFSFCEDRNGDVWIGTDGGGISVWDRNTNQFKKYTVTPGKNGLASNNIPDMAVDDDGNVLIAGFQSDILRFNRNTKTFQKVLTAGPVASGFAWRFYKDRAGDIWTVCRGLFKYDKRTGTLVPVNNVPGAFLALTGDRNNHLWLGNWDQVLCIDKEGKPLLTYKTSAQVRSILETKDGAIWVGTQGSGLLKYYKGRWKMYTEKQGLPNNNVLNILEDNNGAIWMSTFNGISKFTPASEIFENFFDVDGLQSNQFYYNAALKLRSGELMFGGINGFTIFKPEACVPEKTFPPLGITGIRILNQPVQNTGEFVKGASIYAPDEITLPYSKSFISIDFAALEYSLPGKIQYAYFLEGWDKTWSLPGNGRTANYSELKEGNYVLRIRNTNTSGIWNTKELRLPIIILPPWYRTWWFRLSVLLVVLGMLAVLLYYWERERRIKYKMTIAELKHQHEQELNEKRLSFFTNISHEFRSPLTLIINPINEIIKNGTATAEDYNLRVVQSNAQRLLKITDQLLLFRKTDNEFGKIEPVNLDLVNLCRQVFFCFSDEAVLKSLTYDFNCGLEQAQVYADAEKIEIIIFNLIANAIKFSPQHGRVCVKLEAQDDRFMIAVSDNGPGVPPNIGDKLFQKFYQVPDKQTAGSAKGFGIGLYLSKAFADMHEANLSYSCLASGGTVFSFGLKKVTGQAEKIVDSNIAVQAFLNHPVITNNRKEDHLSELVGEKKVMLVIDNDRQLTAYIKKLFSYLTVYEAENGEEGWKKVQELAPDIIICDVVMDESNGIEVCKKIKSSSSYGHIPVILLTGCSAADMRLKGAECGADDYILKPFESELVIARVNNILKDRAMLKKFFFNEITLQAAEPLKVADEFRGFLADCIAIVEANIERDDFDSKVFAKKMGISRSKLYTKVKAISGLSVNEFVKLIRLRKAAELMIKTDGQVKEIAFQVGFNDPKYFSEQFTRLFQLKPSEYIKKYRDSFQDKTHLNDQFSRIKKR